MSDTSVQAAAPAPPAVAALGAITVPNVRRPRLVRWPLRALKALASLRLTVVLFALSLVLVFCGTLAQVDLGIWSVVGKYFRSYYVWIPFLIFFPRTWHVPGGFPFPGGWLIGGLLLVNLLAAHAVRFKVSWKRSGILLIHSGLIVMMLGEFVTGMFAVEGNMTIVQGESSSYTELADHSELAVVGTADPKVDDVVVVPDQMLKKGGTIQSDELPFDVEVNLWMANSGQPRAPRSGESNPATAGHGSQLITPERREASGADSNQKRDVVSAYVTFRRKDNGESLGTYLLSPWFTLMSEVPPQKVVLDGQTYEVALRFKRAYKPYTVHLIKFSHDVYPGTNTPKNFSSLVRVVDPSRGVDREVLIPMNQPLRYEGETFYQSSFLPDDEGTVLQVVRNPGWLMPYFSCALVTLGMLVHFGMNLSKFLGVDFSYKGINLTGLLRRRAD
jgi:hypothetical protein